MFGRKKNNDAGDGGTVRYEAEVTVETRDGQEVVYRGDAVGPETPGDQLLDSVEAAALQREPGGKVVSSRARRARR